MEFWPLKMQKRSPGVFRETAETLISKTNLCVCLSSSNSAGDGSTDHGVVAHADQTHHLNVCRHRRRTCKLRIAVHAAQRVGQAVAGRAGCDVIGVQGTARAAAGSDGEVLLAVLDGPLLVGAGDQVLEADGVGGVAGDGALNVLLLHDGNALHERR